MPVPFLSCGGSWLGCVVVPVMRALFQSRGWLQIVEAPRYSRHPASILAMQLLKVIYYSEETGILFQVSACLRELNNKAKT